MDLRAEPIILSVPAVDPKRYYSVMLCDGNTYNYGYIGTRATGSEAGDHMVVRVHLFIDRDCTTESTITTHA